MQVKGDNENACNIVGSIDVPINLFIILIIMINN
jgi:hypothetical protein